jgi:hypothetical protein
MKRNNYGLSMIMLLVVLLNSCTNKITFPVSTVAPAANAHGKIKKDNNNNYVIDLEVDNLTSPERLSPAKKMYVVWMETVDNGTKNIGQLSTSDSNNGSLRAITPFKPRQIIITAEDQSNISLPSSNVVLKSNLF